MWTFSASLRHEIIRLEAHDFMAIQLEPETERLVQEELRSGHFHSVDEIIVQAIRFWHERKPAQRNESQRREAVDRVLDFALRRAVQRDGISIKELVHEGHRV